MPACLRDALRQFFPSQSAQGKSYSPIDDARFKSGIPDTIKTAGKYLPGAVIPGAITLGLYDIYYDPAAVHLNGGGVKDLEAIIEEVSHTVQFLQVWAGLTQDSYLLKNHGEDTSDYNHAMAVWSNNYSYYAIKAAAKLNPPYDNDIERWAQGNVRSVITSLRAGDRSQVCGYNLYPGGK